MTSKHDLTPPPAVAANARKGLKLHGDFGRGGTEVGVKRAEGLMARHPVSEEEIGHISSYFARHEVDKKTHTHTWGDDADPSAGYIAWLLWGGDEGRAWVDEVKAKIAKGQDR